MGVLNVTPDSFSDGGCFYSAKNACKHALQLVEQGVDLIDVGGESTRPNAHAISAEEELDRVIPVIQKIRAYSDVCLSIDTYKPQIMKEAVSNGANVINDVYALQTEGSLQTAAILDVPICLMHMQGTPQTMQAKLLDSQEILQKITTFFEQRLKACYKSGIDLDKIILDPGFGFGKSVHANLYMLKALSQFKGLTRPLLVGVSRKSTIGSILKKTVENRLIGSIALAIYASLNGANIIRVHDVDETIQALKIIEMVCNANEQYEK